MAPGAALPKRPGLWLPPSGSAAGAVGGGRAPAPVVTTISAKAAGGTARPRSEAMSLMAEMKFKQEKRDLRARLKRELDELTASGVNDLLRVATLRGQLASVESFLAQTDGVQSLAPQATAPPVNPGDDVDSTNLYVGSLAPEWTEEMLMREFGRFGDVTSIKIMYPRTELQRLRGMNCGFVQFRTRRQAENAKARLNGREFFGMCLRIDWGKAVQPGANWGNRPNLQPHLQPHVEGPPAATAGQGGAPQFPAVEPHRPAERKSRWNKAKTIVVSIPEITSVKRLIDKTAEFVVLEGWDFETQLLDRECENPRFAFLKCDKPEALEDPLHVYYRWRVFSYAQGDSDEQWRTEPFQVYDNGPLWQPPPCDHKERTAEDDGPALMIPHFDVIRQPGLAGAAAQRRRGSGGVGSLDLSVEEQRNLDQHIAGLTMSRASILAAMAFCLDASAASQQISQRICSSIVEAQPGLTTAQLSARLFLLSDVLFNSHCTRPGASMYRRQFQEFLPDVFERLGEVCDGIAPIAAAALRERVGRLLRAWSEWSTFPPQFVKGLEATLCCRGSQRPGLAELEGGAEEAGEGAKSKTLQLRLQQWRATSDPASLERACRLRGLATKGAPRDLVERLCAFEAYWHAKEPEHSPHQAAVAAAAAALLRQQRELEVFDPELDGEALDEEELGALAVLEQEEREARAQEDLAEPGHAANLLLGGPDLRSNLCTSGDTAIEVAVAADGGSTASNSATTAPAARGAEAGVPKSEANKEAKSCEERVHAEAPGAAAAGPAAAPEGGGAESAAEGPNGEADGAEEQRRKARLRQVESEVLKFQLSLEQAHERPDLIAMKCDRKRMQLLESAAREEAMLDLQARGPGDKSKPQEGPAAAAAATPAPAAPVLAATGMGAPHAAGGREEPRRKRSSPKKTSPKLAANPGQTRAPAASEAVPEAREEGGAGPPRRSTPGGSAAGAGGVRAGEPPGPPAPVLGSPDRQQPRKAKKEQDKPEKLDKNRKKCSPSRSGVGAPPAKQKRSRSPKRSQSRSAASGRGRRREDNRGGSKAAAPVGAPTVSGMERAGGNSHSRSRERERKGRRSRSHSRARKKR